MKVMTLIRMIAIKFSRGRSLFSVLMDDGVLFFEIMYDSFSYEMRGNVVGNDRKFRGIPDGMNDTMSNGSGDGGGENDVEVEDISVLVSKFVF